MSSTTLYRICPGSVQVAQTYRPSQGSAWRVWDSLARRYLDPMRGLRGLRDMQPLWGLARLRVVPTAWRRCLAWTFDYACCPPAFVPALAQACAEVGAALDGEDPRAANHRISWA